MTRVLSLTLRLMLRTYLTSDSMLLRSARGLLRRYPTRRLFSSSRSCDAGVTNQNAIASIPTGPARRRRSWRDPAARRAQFDDMAKDLGISSPLDWYRISKADIYRVQGAGLLRSRYNDSLFAALSSVYPEHRWLEWKFSCVQRRFWATADNQRRFLLYVAESIGIHPSSTADWARLTQQQVIDHGGSRLLHLNADSIPKALSFAFPELDWTHTGNGAS